MTARKRYASRAAQRLALGSIAATGLSLAACEQPPRDIAFNSITECVRAGFDAQVCQAEYGRALAASAETAPRFGEKAVCETQFSRCEEVKPQGEAEAASGSGASNASGGSFFVPFLTGYVMSSALRNLSFGGYANHLRQNPNYSAQPVYRDWRGRDVRTARQGGRTVTRPLNPATRTAARRGFGSRGFGRGFGG